MSVELISVHIPKCAGVSFRTLLEAIYEPYEILYDYKNSKATEDISDEDIKVIHGHFALDKYNISNAKKMTWIREPVSRIVSNYYYYLYFDPKDDTVNDELHKFVYEKKPSLQEFSRMDWIINHMSKSIFRNIRPKDLFFVGIVERMREDTEYLIKTMNWPKTKIGTFNTTTELNKNYLQQKNNIPKKILDEIRDLNQDDMAIYKEALEMRLRK